MARMLQVTQYQSPIPEVFCAYNAPKEVINDVSRSAV